MNAMQPQNSDPSLFSSAKKEYMDRHVTLTVEAIYAGLFAGKNPMEISFRTIINRVMVLAQAPITFVLVQHENNKTISRHPFNRHPRDVDAIEKSSIESEHAKYRFDLFGLGSRYYLQVLIAERDKNNKYTFPALPAYGKSSKNDWLCEWRDDKRNQAVETLQEISYKLERIFDIAPYKTAYGDTFISLIDKSLEDCFPPNSQLDVSVYSEVPDDDADYQHYLKYMLKDTSNYQFRKYGVIDRLYAKLRDNLIFISNFDNAVNAADRLPNFILFSRDYTKNANYLRHGDYKYRIGIMLSSSQEEDVRSFLKRQQIECKINNNKKTYLSHIRSQTENSDKISLAEELDNLFWTLVETKKDGHDQIIAVLKTPLGETSRSMADPVYDGITYFRDPFFGGGIDRCFVRGTKPPAHLSEISSEAQRNDLLRLTICHYLFHDMAQAKEGDTLSIMLNPVEIGGRIWGVSGFITRTPPAGSSQASWEHQDQRWRRNYQIYHEINLRLKRNIRLSMEQAYYGHLAKIYEDEILKVINAKVEVPILQKSINNRFERLVRYYPYDLIEINIKRATRPGIVPSHTNPFFAFITNGVHAEVSSQSLTPIPMPYGKRESGKFVKEQDIAVRMSDSIIKVYIDASSAEGQKQ